MDEAEFYSALRTEDREFAEILLKTFAAECLGEEALRFDPAELPRGGATVHRQFGYRYKEKQALHAIFALTHDPVGETLLKRIVNRRCFLEFSPFGLSEYRVLAERVLALYRLAGAKLELQTKLPSPMAMVMEACHGQGVIENPRQALKFVTEIVDIVLCHHNLGGGYRYWRCGFGGAHHSAAGRLLPGATHGTRQPARSHNSGSLYVQG